MTSASSERIYVAGPMTGYTDWNFAAFFATADRLRALGHTPINPAENDGTTLAEAVAGAHASTASWSDYMRRDIRHISRSDAVCVLPGWQQSKGATLEVDVATRLGLPIYCLTDDGLVPRVRAIGLSGYARAGKDTAAAILADQGWQRASFAAALKDALYALDPLTSTHPGYCVSQIVHEPVDWERAKDDYPEVRRLLQRMGTEVGREFFGENCWVDLAFRRIPDGSRVVFSDCRFPNEAAAIKAAGGELWRIERPGCSPVNAHPSETALDEYAFDWYITNDGTLDDLRSLIGAASWFVEDSCEYTP